MSLLSVETTLLVRKRGNLAAAPLMADFYPSFVLFVQNVRLFALGSHSSIYAFSRRPAFLFALLDVFNHSIALKSLT